MSVSQDVFLLSQVWVLKVFLATQPSTPARWRLCFACVCVLLRLLPLFLGKLHIADTQTKRWSLGKGEEDVSTVFTRPSALSLSPAPSSEKKSFQEMSLLSLPRRAGGWERAVPSAPGSAAPRPRSLAGAAAPQFSDSGAPVAAPRHAERKGPRRDAPPSPPAPPRASPWGSWVGALGRCWRASP